MDAPEDVAWADSCLSKDPDMIETGWNSLKDALFEALNAQHDPSPHEIVDSSEAADMDIVHNTENDIDRVEEKFFGDFVGSGEGGDSGLNSPKYVSLETLSGQFQSSHYDIAIMPLLKQDVLEEMLSPVSIAATSNGAEPKGDGSEDADAFLSKHKMEDIFLPTYDESLRNLGLSDPEVDFMFQEFELEQSTEDIFKIWDFDTPPEENDLMKQLNKALAGNPLEAAPPFSDDSDAWNVLQDRSVDDLISGIADLTLNPISGQSVLT